MFETISDFESRNFCFSIISRGKVLHSAMNSLQNLDKSFDNFLGWLSEAESSMETIEAEFDRCNTLKRDNTTAMNQLKVCYISFNFKN